MRPAGMPSSRVKLRPWYYADRDAPSRAAAKTDAIETDLADSGEDEQEADNK